LGHLYFSAQRVGATEIWSVRTARRDATVSYFPLSDNYSRLGA